MARNNRPRVRAVYDHEGTIWSTRGPFTAGWQGPIHLADEVITAPQESPTTWSPLNRQLSRATAVTILIVLYAVAWGGLLLSSGGVYWDDWIYVSAPPGQILQMTRELGLPWVGFLLLFLLHLGPVAYHVLSLLLFLSVGISTFGILRRVPSLTPNEQIFLAALVLVLPLIAARHALSVQQYAFSYALFYLAWYLLVRASPPGRVTLCTAGILFAASFTTNSLLVFYLLPMSHLLFQVGYRPRVPLTRLLWSYWPLLALPGAWYAAKLAFLQPYGLYANYNQITSGLLVNATALLALAFLPLGAVYLVRRRLGSRTRGISTALSAGLFLTVLAIYPYMVVDKGPPFMEWETRNELLMPLGIAFVVLAICRTIRAVLGRGVAQLAGMGVLTGSIVVSAAICGSYFVDWEKQQSLIEMFRATPALESASSVIFRDDTTSMNIFGRSYRFYEWNGLMTRAFGDETRFGVNNTRREIRRLLGGAYGRFALYGARNYVPDGTVVQVRISSPYASSPWYESLSNLSGYIPNYGEIRIQTRVSTTEQALEGALVWR
jgi:hypothetical protein